MRIKRSFFQRDVLDVAPDILGRFLVCRTPGGHLFKSRITEVEVYRGQEDLACHASKGRTSRTEVMFVEGGVVYVYLIYGMYWLLNLVTGEKDQPQALLVRGIEDVTGPGRVGRLLKLDRSFYGENLETSKRLWVESDGKKFAYATYPRVGIDYAGEYWKNVPWRYVLEN